MTDTVVYQMAIEVFKVDVDEPIYRVFERLKERPTIHQIRKRAADLAALFPNEELEIDISLVDTYSFETKPKKRSHLTLIKPD